MSDWVRICHMAELLPGEVQTGYDGDTPIAVFNVDGELYALEDICTHDGAELTGGPIHGYAVEGVGEDFYPDTFDPSVVDRYERVSDAESFAMVRRLVREEGLLVGGSAGANVAAAVRIAARGGLHGPVVDAAFPHVQL